MRIFDETKTQELTFDQCDLNLGALFNDLIQNEDGVEEIQVYKPFTATQLLQMEKSNLENWFNTDYKELFEKCKRKIDLGLNLRDGTSPQERLNALYAEAESKADRIHVLKGLIAEAE